MGSLLGDAVQVEALGVDVATLCPRQDEVAVRLDGNALSDAGGNDAAARGAVVVEHLRGASPGDDEVTISVAADVAAAAHRDFRSDLLAGVAVALHVAAAVVPGDHEVAIGITGNATLTVDQVQRGHADGATLRLTGRIETLHVPVTALERALLRELLVEDYEIAVGIHGDGIDDVLRRRRARRDRQLIARRRAVGVEHPTVDAVVAVPGDHVLAVA